MSLTWEEQVAQASGMLRLFPKAYAGQKPDEIAFAAIALLDRIIDRLRSSRHSALIRIFGSAQSRPDRIPGDIDLFLDMRETDVVDPGETGLMPLTREVWPVLDPFVLTRSGLWCRSAASTGSGLSWIPAQRSRAIVNAGSSGVLLSDFTRKFSSLAAWTPPAAPEPDPAP